MISLRNLEVDRGVVLVVLMVDMVDYIRTLASESILESVILNEGNFFCLDLIVIRRRYVYWAFQSSGPLPVFACPFLI